MDFATLIALAVALAATGFASHVWGGAGGGLSPALAAVLLVIGGSFSALLVHFSLPALAALPRHLRRTLRERPEVAAMQRVAGLAGLAERARRSGVLSLAEEAGRIEDGFFRRCVEMVVDGGHADEIGRVMGRELSLAEADPRQATRMLRWAAAYAALFGAFGTLLALPGVPGAALATADRGAAVSAFWPLLCGAALVPTLLAAAGRVAESTGAEAVLRALTVEGIVGIAGGEHPAVLRRRLAAFAAPGAVNAGGEVADMERWRQRRGGGS
ncbi:MAG: MotA/TolQ/ExbB proton channel family protein [Nitrospirota bacterium]|nr:MotA/TolQ/ExbB proton channel family protein [Nitrospirota bacterium]